MKRIVITLTLLTCFGLAKAQWVSTVAGVVETPGSDDGAALSSRFFIPHGIAADSLGNIYIADRNNHTIRKLDSNTGIVVTLAGKAGESGSTDGIGSAARFKEPWGVCATPDGTVYVADTKNNKIRRILPDGTVSTIAGTGNFGTSNGPGLSSTFGEPTGLEVDADGNIYVADHLTHIIRRINKLGNVSTLAGKPYLPGDADGTGADAEFWRPYGLSLDLEGNILVADEWNHKIRKVTPQGLVTTFAGNGVEGLSNGDKSDASFSYPWDITVDPEGNVYVGDGYNYVVRKIDLDGNVTTFAGSPEVQGSQDGGVNIASFKGVTSLAWSSKTESIYACDAYNHTIRNITVGNAPPTILSLLSLAGGASICEGEVFQLMAIPDSLEKYRFYLDGTMVQDNADNEFSTTQLTLGAHTFVVEAEEAGKVLTSNPIEITVKPTPQPVISAVGPLDFYEGDSVVLFVTGTGEFLWSNAETTQTVTIRESGDYFVEASLDGCVGISAPVRVEVTPLPDALSVLVQGNNRLCPNSTVSLASSAAFGNQWFKDGWPITGQTEQTLEAAEPGLYMVQATDLSTGITALSNEVEILAAQMPNFDFDASPKKALPGYPITFASTGTDQPSTYEWQFGDANSGTQNSSPLPNPTHVFYQEGIYDIQLIATDANGCKHTVQKPALVEISEFDGIFLPNAFTPNGDGENDHFRVRGVVNGPFFMAIYNQWGELLYQSSDPSAAWDGNKDGLPVQPGTYVYLVQFQSQGEQKDKAGKVTLLR
ncbi:MAG: gliding motility-associated C-terminal domain-containing protein [Saprospiraceae bacterium]|nr:gliding motility-associated C-terminal domain-containing protein [Saprospiraceae bacterium]